MAEERNDGGPAFPFEFSEVRSRGMSQRDWFAGRAMQGFMLGLAEHLVSDGDAASVRQAIDNTGRLAYLIADAMLRERERG